MKTFLRSRRAQIGLAALALCNFAQAGVMAQGATRAYFANDPLGRNVVSITSNAPLETMLTTTGQIEADIKINPGNVLDNPRAKFVIPVASLDTGIKIRNDHMLESDWLDAAKFPNISFTLLKPLGTGNYAAQNGAKGAMAVEGELEFHGVKKIVRADVEVAVIGETEKTKERLDGEMMHIRATFPIKLDDFGVMIPEMAKLKIANVQDVKVDVFVSTGSKAPKWAAPVADVEIRAGQRVVSVQTPVGPVRLNMVTGTGRGVNTQFGVGPGK